MGVNILKSVKSKILYEVVLIRLILIVLLVLYHAFAMYNGAWKMPEGIHEVKAYWWIASFAYSFMLEAFVFVSGYVYGYQVRTKYNCVVDFNTTVLRKAKRLLIPSITFSILYFICFNLDKDINIGRLVYNILNGEGHMWFLPMLFWCFVMLFLVEKFHISSKYAFPLAILMAVCSFLPLPFRISSAAYYFLFFYCGYLIQSNDIQLGKFYKGRNVVMFGVLFLSAFISLKLLLDNSAVIVFSQQSIFHKAVYLASSRVCSIVYATLGLIFIYLFIEWLISVKSIVVSDKLVVFSTYCFGVYIYQQFILKMLINNSSIVSSCGSYWLPWTAFAIALCVSIILTLLTLRTKLGRFLLG